MEYIKNEIKKIREEIRKEIKTLKSNDESINIKLDEISLILTAEKERKKKNNKFFMNELIIEK
jgi:hypothetical protein